MAGRGGKQPGAGRPAGAANKATQERQTQVAATGPTPLDAMLYKMRFHLSRVSREQDKGALASQKVIEDALDKAEEAAAKAAPYVHPRLTAIAVQARIEHNIDLTKLNEAELEQLERIVARAASVADRDQEREGATQH